MVNHLDTIVWLLALVVGAVLLVRAVGLPAIPGYLLVGVVVGFVGVDHGDDGGRARALGEFGVVFLMFSIGLEFSLQRLQSMKRLVLGLGTLQMVTTTLLFMVAAMLWGANVRAGFLLGGALAMSSTAVVIKMLAEKYQLDTPYGKEVTSVLLFQDLAVVPYLALLPSLEGPHENLMSKLMTDLGGALLTLIVILFFGRAFMRRWFDMIARRNSEELFMLNVLLIILSLSWLAEISGMPLALGAFIAGILVAETDHRAQVAADIRPFRDVLLGLFFVTIGLQLDERVIFSDWPMVLAILVLLLICKFSLVFGLVRAFGAEAGQAVRSGLYLAAGGEFGLVMLSQAGDLNYIDHNLLHASLAAVILSLLIAPFLIQHGDAIVLRLVPSEWFRRSQDLTRLAAASMPANDHIILCGYGRTGQHLAHILEQEQTTYLALDIDADRVRHATLAGEPVVFGNAARREVLRAAGVTRAHLVVITYADSIAALKTLATIRELNAYVQVVVRTAKLADVVKLESAGATTVITDELEASLMIAVQTLALAGTPLRRVLKLMRDARETNYQLLQGFFLGASDEGEVDEQALRLKALNLPVDAYACGKRLQDLDLASFSCTLMGLRRQGERVNKPDATIQLAPADVLILHGRGRNLSTVEDWLLRGVRSTA